MTAPTTIRGAPTTGISQAAKNPKLKKNKPIRLMTTARPPLTL